VERKDGAGKQTDVFERVDDYVSPSLLGSDAHKIAIAAPGIPGVQTGRVTARRLQLANAGTIVKAFAALKNQCSQKFELDSDRLSSARPRQIFLKHYAVIWKQM
jgi:hypothetical protein